MNISSLPQDRFTVLTHHDFPAQQLRIKRTEFCDPTVKAWTGYVDVDYGSKHLFFYFFESRGNPERDDVVMWINGGPGCSSATGLLMELGPCNIDMDGSSNNGTLWNPYAWNSNANVFFLDQPVGVGFSYADFGETIETTEDAAKNVQAFVRIFFESFPQFAGRKFHLSGESYGGKYLPVMAAEIYDQERKRTEGVPINLSSVIIGNGITDISTLYPGRYAIACGTAALDAPILEVSTCVRVQKALPRCQRLLNDNCIDIFDDMACNAAVKFCDAEISAPLQTTGRNVYDVSKMCLGDSLCYLEEDRIAAFLNNDTTRGILGIPSRLGTFTGCSNSVGRGFASHLDKWRLPAQYYVSNLLERGIRVLLYAGTYDWQCNWVANWEWSNSLEWSGGSDFRAQSMRDWSVPDKQEVAGQTRTAGKLTFTTLYGAGHMVPHDKPAEALHMIQRWLAEEEI
ncbi:peptidase S10 serine carboxypeptidase [Hysterangium stoloniferum]|nr:peptidase S10 serine carboxypeptidase [Hysterangium stoloniferum]